MIKELILAIALGALLGFGVTGGYFAFNKKNTTNIVKSTSVISAIPTISSTEKMATNPAANPGGSTDTSDNGTESHEIKIDQPGDNDISSSSKITLKGSTSPNSYLVITSPSHIFNGKADNAGNFAIDVELDSGANLINIESIDSADNQAKTTITITYSTAKL